MMVFLPMLEGISENDWLVDELMAVIQVKYVLFLLDLQQDAQQIAYLRSCAVPFQRILYTANDQLLMSTQSIEGLFIAIFE
jgi:hypothetical protein